MEKRTLIQKGDRKFCIDKQNKNTSRDLSVYGKLIRNQFLIDVTNKDVSETYAATL